MPYPTEVKLHHDQTEDVDGVLRRQREGWPARPVGEENPRPRWRASQAHRDDAALGDLPRETDRAR